MFNNTIKRRRFLKCSSLGVAAASTPAFLPRIASAAWSEGMQINPAIPNDRIVCCHDNAMFPGFGTEDGALNSVCSSGECLQIPFNMSAEPLDIPINRERFSAQNDGLDSSRIDSDLDACATTLAQKGTPSDAWSTIFMNGTKSWSEIRVAILLDTLSLFPVHVPIIGKLCGVLHGLGVPYSNIILYDGQAYVWDYENKVVKSGIRYFYEPYAGNGIPEGVVLSDGFDGLGGLVEAPVPEPFAGNFLCAKDIAEGSVDIVINIATNKSEGDLVVDTALCLYNHFGGTFVRYPRTPFSGIDILNYMTAVNKSNAVIGSNPPRQQLCIIDSIWGNHCCGPYGTHLSRYSIDRQPNRLIMGTCAPLVDVVTIEKLRKKMSAHVEGFPDRFLVDFGFSTDMWDTLAFTEVSV